MCAPAAMQKYLTMEVRRRRRARCPGPASTFSHRISEGSGPSLPDSAYFFLSPTMYLQTELPQPRDSMCRMAVCSLLFPLGALACREPQPLQLRKKEIKTQILPQNVGRLRPVLPGQRVLLPVPHHVPSTRAASTT